MLASMSFQIFSSDFLKKVWLIISMHFLTSETIVCLCTLSKEHRTLNAPVSPALADFGFCWLQVLRSVQCLRLAGQVQRMAFNMNIHSSCS